MGVPNVLFSIGYAPNEETLNRLHHIKPKYLSERRFYSCRQNNNDILKYINRGINEGEFLSYAGNLEKSSGLFSGEGLLTKKQIKDLRTMLRQTDSNIWHAVISFTEEFGAKYMTSYQDAMELLKAELPKFFRHIGIAEDNVVWYAGLHENTDNQHIHLGFFEKEPRFIAESGKKRYRFGSIGKEAMDSFRIGIEERLTDVGFDLKRSRRNLTETTKKTVFHLEGMNDYERNLKRKLLALYKAMPLEGRVSYGSKNMDSLRPQVNEIVNDIIRGNSGLKRDYEDFCSDLAEFDANRRRICEEQKIAEVEKYLISEKYIRDLYRRLGDTIIKAAITTKRKVEKETKQYKKESARKRAEKRYSQYLFDRAMQIGAEVDDEAIRCFEEYRWRLARAEYNRLVEGGEIESE